MRDGLLKIVLLLWALPLVLFWGWYGLSVNGVDFGTVLLSRELNELVFRLYGQMLGVAPDKVPAMIAGACVIDTGVIGAIAAWRWRALWYPPAAGFVAARLAGLSRGGEGEGGAPATAGQDGRAHPAE
ncbi:MAG: hypothetical protein BroJett030_29680 [Alphaproteobacteria bacterium]|nr:MAG: hypothetical protein BroJett030_29680 [Alphaproteobacteria bacterium]